MWGKAIVVVLLAVLANFYLGGRTEAVTERPSDTVIITGPSTRCSKRTIAGPTTIPLRSMRRSTNF